MKDEYLNIIGGRDISLSGKYFYAESPFYKGYKIKIADAGKLDLALVVSKLNNAQNTCSKLSFDDCKKILLRASKKIVFKKEDVEHVVRMTGMPYKYVRIYLDEIARLFKTLPELCGKKYGVINGELGKPLHDGSHKLELRVPAKGFVYAITPANDPRVSALVAAILVTAGMRGVLKVSKSDVPIAYKIIKTIIDCGYPVDALAVVSFDTAKPESKELNFELVDKAGIIWPFGDDKTVDRLLRFETRDLFDIDRFMRVRHIDNLESQFETFREAIAQSRESLRSFIVNHKIDHFSDKVILRHGSGRCAGILDNDYDLNEAADILIDSSMRYPIGCNSMKSVFIPKRNCEKLLAILEKRIQKLEELTSDPLDPATEVGYIEPTLLKTLTQRIEELKRMGLVKIVAGGKVKSAFQMTPLLAITHDVHSELLLNEYSAYILAVKPSKNFEAAVEELNSAAGEFKKLAVSILTHNPAHSRAKVNAHHIKINELTTDIDGIVHEGNDYIAHLTKPCIVTHKHITEN